METGEIFEEIYEEFIENIARDFTTIDKVNFG